MSETKIACPRCGQEFELTEALSGRLRAHLRDELSGEITRREAELAEKTRALTSQKEDLQKARESIDEEHCEGSRDRLFY